MGFASDWELHMRISNNISLNLNTGEIHLVARRFDPDYVAFMIGTILLQLTLACAIKALLGLLKAKRLKQRLK